MRRLPILIPHRPGCADFPLPVLHGRALLAEVQMTPSVTCWQRKTRGRTSALTCCLRFKTGVATTPARLASGWLARLYREGVEPSGSLQKVSDRSLILLFWIYPGAREVSF